MKPAAVPALLVSFFLTTLGAGCATNTAPVAPTAAGSSADAPAASGEVAKPTPSTVTKEEPGGDSADPELAALTRLAEEPISRRWDKPETLQIRLVDSKVWRRVRAETTPSRAMFRYGDDTYALAVIFYQPAEEGDDPKSCLKQFMKFADDQASTFDVSYQTSPVYDREQKVAGDSKKPMVVQLLEGHVNAPFFQDDYVGGVAAYQSFPKTCLVEAFAALSTHHPDAARRARDRWVNDAAPGLEWDPRHVGADAPPFEDR
jgi:hypothetical protein